MLAKYDDECGVQTFDAPHLPDNVNFLIRWKGMDWSGYGTFAERLGQFRELWKGYPADELWAFTLEEDR